jgi:fatty acid desaturase
MKSSQKSYSFNQKLSTLLVLDILLGIAILLAPWPAKLLPQILFGAMFAHGVELLHELNHGKQFLNERLNQSVGLVLGLPLLTSPTLYKFLHGGHHKNLGTPQDTESFAYSYDQLTTIKGFIQNLSMSNHYLASINYMRTAVLDAMQLRDDMPLFIKTRIRYEFRLMASFIAIMLVLSIVFQTRLFLDVWFIPLILGGGPAHALIELPEHIECDSTTTDVFKNTRSIRASRFAQWYTNGNCFHVEHHLNPSLELDELRELHEEIATRIENLENSYPAFYGRILRDILHNGFK